MLPLLCSFAEMLHRADLLRFQQTEPISPKLHLFISTRVSVAISFSHSRKYVHSDPSNRVHLSTVKHHAHLLAAPVKAHRSLF